MRDLAVFYHHWYGNVLGSFEDRYKRDLLGAFKGLQDRGRIEIATSAATHGYLPLLARDSSIYGQIKTGVDAYKRHFGRDPKAIWLPECAYRPAIVEQRDGGDVRRPAWRASWPSADSGSSSARRTRSKAAARSARRPATRSAPTAMCRAATPSR